LIPSLDTYVFNQVKSNLTAILSSPKIVDTALQGLDKNARDSFKQTYCGENANREINVTYVFPQNKEGFDALYFIQLGEGEEKNDSLGLTEGTYDTREGGTNREPVSIQVDYESNRLFMEVAKPIASIDGYDGITFAKSDEVTLEGNRIYFKLITNEHLIGADIVVNYTDKLDNLNPIGIKKGFTSRDTVIITPLSTNMDTSRCLDALLKVILIIMRQTVEEQSAYALQTAYFEPMQALETGADRIAFGRPLTIAYTVSYSLDFDLAQLKDILVSIKKPVAVTDLTVDEYTDGALTHTLDPNDTYVVD